MKLSDDDDDYDDDDDCDNVGSMRQLRGHEPRGQTCIIELHDLTRSSCNWANEAKMSDYSNQLSLNAEYSVRWKRLACCMLWKMRTST